MAAQLVMTSVRLAPELHAQLRKLAFERRTSMHSLLLEGAKYVASQYEVDGSPPEPTRPKNGVAIERERGNLKIG